MAPRDAIPPAQARGRQAEDLACLALTQAGLRVVGRNLRLGGGELDLVAWEGPTLVFVEVKGRGKGGLGAAEESIGPLKRRRLVGAAGAYLARLEGPEPPCRFDVVTVEYDRGRPRLKHLRDAFRPGD
ncbi:MAG: YraN family protein [Thermodesulfobacteriota bacterium]